MLSVAPLAQGPGYYLELANINYYAEGGEPLPTWHGTAAKEFGLSGTAERSHVERLCSGYHHETEKGLVRNAGTPERNPGHDLTFSAPKSVSVAWAMADEALRKAIGIKHEEAVREALDFIESKAGFARIGKQGQELVRAPLLFALFEHGTSRTVGISVGVQSHDLARSIFQQLGSINSTNCTIPTTAAADTIRLTVVW